MYRVAQHHNCKSLAAAVGKDVNRQASKQAGGSDNGQTHLPETFVLCNFLFPLFLLRLQKKKRKSFRCLLTASRKRRETPQSRRNALLHVCFVASTSCLEGGEMECNRRSNRRIVKQVLCCSISSLCDPIAATC